MAAGELSTCPEEMGLGGLSLDVPVLGLHRSEKDRG